MSREKEARRTKAEGRNPKDTAKSNTTYNGAPPAQPIPGAPQGQGNLMNTPQTAMTMQGSTDNPSSMTGFNLYPYMDGGQQQTRGAIANPSGVNQGNTIGTGRNANIRYGMQPQPNDQQARMIEPEYFAQSSIKTAQKAGAAKATIGDPNAMTPAYNISAMGPIGSGPEMPPIAGAYPGAMDTRRGNELPLQGMPDSQMAAQMGLVEGPMGMKGGKNQMGMSTGRGGGRNRKKTA